MATKREERPTATVAVRDAQIMKAMQRWSDAELELEQRFAEAGVVETWPETVAWRDAIRAESARRAEAPGASDAAA